MINSLGPIAAFTAFFSIWFGHVAVRKTEAISPTVWIPSMIFAVLGITCEWLSLRAPGLQLATVFGILGMTLLFDAFELTRQERRIIRGHAPANPDNPRHAKILTEYPSATTSDLLKREPINFIFPVADNPKMRKHG
jgi:hypothetical protein